MHYILLRIIKLQLIAIYNSANEFARVMMFVRHVEVFPADLFLTF